jgi:alpha-tubulin suppressor-like RCC1 family protein
LRHSWTYSALVVAGCNAAGGDPSTGSAPSAGGGAAVGSTGHGAGDPSCGSGGHSTTVVDIAAGDRMAMAITADRRLWCWGAPYTGVCPVAGDVERPRLLPHTCVDALETNGPRAVIAADGDVVSWGGEVGTSILTIPAAASWIRIASRIAWGEAGRVWTVDRWNTTGSPMSLEPVEAPYNADLAVERDDGTVFLWEGRVFASGVNHAGQLGDGTNQPSEQFLEVPLPLPVVDLSESYGRVIVVLSDGRLFTWGAGPNSTGQPIPDPPTPHQFEGFDRACGVSTYAERACTWSCDGEVWCWGLKPWPAMYRMRDLEPARKVAVTSASPTCALKMDGTVWCRGLEGRGGGDPPEDGSATQVIFPDDG